MSIKNLRALVQVVVNSHYAQTGIPTVDGEQVRELVVEILGDISDQDFALLEQITEGELRAGPTPVEEN